MTLHLVTVIYMIFVCAKCYVIHISLDQIKSIQFNYLLVQVNLDMTDHCTTDLCI